jgi:hypothetical protein
LYSVEKRRRGSLRKLAPDDAGDSGSLFIDAHLLIDGHLFSSLSREVKTVLAGLQLPTIFLLLPSVNRNANLLTSSYVPVYDRAR